MNTKLTKTASMLAFIIGAMAVLAGGQVLLGKVKDYYVIDWLPIYNFILGLVSASWTAISIWKSSKIAMLLAKATFASHAVVMLILLTAYQNVVAPDSIVAMTVRLITWAIILTLLFIQIRKGEGA